MYHHQPRIQDQMADAARRFNLTKWYDGANRYDGTCVNCGGPVPAGLGRLGKRNGQYITAHTPASVCEAYRTNQAATPAAPVKRNKYEAPCAGCRAMVPAEAGRLSRLDNGRYIVTHLTEDECKAAAAAKPAEEALPDVPEGHYAVPSRTGNNDLDFWRVDRPTEGTWAGYTFVKRIIGGHPDQRVRGAEAKLALEAILKAGPEAAGQRYGVELGQCCKCNRHLTDETSRALGIGPDCRAKKGA